MYIALRSMQVQGEDGNTRQVKPGDSIPEAVGWKTLRAYVSRGWIAREGQPLNDAASARMARAIKDRDKEISEQSDFIDQQNEEIRNRGDRISQLSSELEEVTGKSSDEPVAPAVDSAPSDASPGHEGGGDLSASEEDLAPSEDPKLTKQELQKMSKDSLMTLADSMGVNPGQSKNKLVEAIFAAQ